VNVPDVPAVLAKVEAAGGKRRLDVQRVGGREDAPRFVYCEDPEGHVFELMEMTRDETVAQIKITLARMADAEQAPS
jgi:predicted enzyme related to lactoylglutathione lyase